MTETVRYQVFVSSTYEDLIHERSAVVKAILEMGHIPVGMEMFSAADEERKIIARNIEESDYYAVLVAHRYGSVVDGLSYTEKEYRYALKIGVPVLGFIIEPEAEWPAGRIDKDDPALTGLRGFKDLVRSKPVSFWKNAEDLAGKTAIALSKTMTANPREGWVRAGSRPGRELTEELGRLSAENARLRLQLEKALSESEAARDRIIAETIDTLNKTPRRISYRPSQREDWEDVGTVPLIEIFHVIAREALSEAEFEQIARMLAFDFKTTDTSTTVPHNHLKSWLADLHTLDLVGPSSVRHSVSDPGDYWSLTDFGREVLKELRRRDLGGGTDEPPEAAIDDDGDAPATSA